MGYDSGVLHISCKAFDPLADNTDLPVREMVRNMPAKALNNWDRQANR